MFIRKKSTNVKFKPDIERFLRIYDTPKKEVPSVTADQISVQAEYADPIEQPKRPRKKQNADVPENNEE